MLKLVVACCLFAACGGEAEPAAGPDASAPPAIPEAPGSIGDACTSDGQCSGAAMSLCIGHACGGLCGSHADCGCPLGTKDDDIAANGCGAACFDFGTVKGCYPVCETPTASAVCSGSCDADPTGSYRVCFPPAGT